MTFPSADKRSSIRWILTLSGIEFRRCWSSWSVVEVGTRSPLRLLHRTCQMPTRSQDAPLSSLVFGSAKERGGETYPAVKRPIIRVPAIVAWQMGMTSWSSASNTLRRKSR